MQRLNAVALTALVIAYALGPMATQILTPAVPFVHRDLGVTMATAQALVSIVFATIAVATLVYGPLSDCYGRRPVILVGTSLFCVGSLVAAVAPSPGWMITGRAIQAAGSPCQPARSTHWIWSKGMGSAAPSTVSWTSLCSARARSASERTHWDFAASADQMTTTALASRRRSSITSA